MRRYIQFVIFLLVPFQVALPQTRGQIKNGITHIDLDGDGVEDLVVKGYVENVSPHSTDIYTFYIHKDSLPGSAISNLVRIKQGSQFNYYVSTRRGADCCLRDIRLAKISKDFSGLQLIIAERPLGWSYVAMETVTFTFYKLTLYSDTGIPICLFEEYAKTHTKKKYCDVNDAFQKELGM